MSIEESFRDAKGVLKLVGLLKRVKDPQVKEGLAFLVFSSLAFLRHLAEEALERISSNPALPLPKSFLGLLKKGYYSLTYFGRLCLAMGLGISKGAKGLEVSLELVGG